MKTILLWFCCYCGQFSFAQSPMLFKKWQWVESYRIDTLLYEAEYDEFSANQQRKFLELSLMERGIENLYWVFTEEGLFYYLEEKLTNEKKINQYQSYRVANNSLFLADKTQFQILFLSDELLILAKNRNHIDVFTTHYAALDVLSDTYILDYWRSYLGKNVKITE
jgi:hypothetical protein